MESGADATGVERAFWLLSDGTRIAILLFGYAVVLLTGFVPLGRRPPS